MVSLGKLIVRDDTPSTANSSQDEMFNPTMNSLLIVLFCLVIVGMSAVTALFVLRSIRRKREMKNAQLPSYHSGGRRPHHRRNLTITTNPYGPNAPSIQVHEKQHYLDSPRGTPSSPVPEIHITFPEEEDKSGRRQSGRVVVVRISDNGGVGLEPYADQSLPPYKQRDGDNWKSLDLERLGGLKEKGHDKQWS